MRPKGKGLLLAAAIFGSILASAPVLAQSHGGGHSSGGGALRKVIDSPDVQAKFKNVGFEGFSSTPEELGDYIKTELAAWKKMIEDAGIKPD